MRRSFATLLAVAVTALGACAPGADPPASVLEQLKPATLRAGDEVPAPQGEPVLRMTGSVRNTNVPRELALDLATIERLGLVSFELDEPFKRRTMAFQGVRLGDVVALAGARGLTSLHSVALNDYVVDIPADVARAGGTLLATRHGDGSPIAVAEGGPVRVVFLDGAPGADVHNYWIWSLARIDLT